jgi:hypothetical protein
MIRSFPPHLYPVEYFVLLHGASPLPPYGPEALPGWRPGERVGHSSPQQSWRVFWNILIKKFLVNREYGIFLNGKGFK